jgi:rare lipoprotein A (peptidoglycan hydrolase)
MNLPEGLEAMRFWLPGGVVAGVGLLSLTSVASARTGNQPATPAANYYTKASAGQEAAGRQMVYADQPRVSHETHTAAASGWTQPTVVNSSARYQSSARSTGASSQSSSQGRATTRAAQAGPSGSYCSVHHCYHSAESGATRQPGFFSRFFGMFRSQQPDPQPAVVASQMGRASWYGPDFHGKPTANGETYDMYSMTAAHKSLPFGTKLRVTNLDNGQQCVVRVNNRGPFVGGRIIDLSKGAAREIGLISRGIARVRLDILGSPRQ